MARKLDAHRNEIAELADVRAEMTKLKAEMNAKLKPLEAREKQLNALLVKAMVNSTEGTVDNRPAVEVVDVGRETVTKARVLTYAPGLYDKLVVKTESFKIKILGG